MPIINNPFNGRLNLDVADYRISNGDYVDAVNITKDAQGIGQDVIVSNIIGNTLVPYTLPEGINKVIGFYADKIRNRAYYFLWNDNGFNSILYYDMNNDSVVKVFESKSMSDGIDILNFDPSYKVVSVNVFYRDTEGDLLYFNDGLNPPKYINVEGNYGNSWKYEYLLVIKAPPIMPPRVTYENDPNVNANNLRNKLFQFSYRYVYVNNEKSVWSSKSIVPLPQQDTLLLTNTDLVSNCRISVSVSTGPKDVKAIEIGFRETTSGVTSDWYLINSFNKSQLGLNDFEIFTYKFYNDSIYSLLDVIETTQLQDYVPLKANAAELANGNVLLYSGITEGYNKTDMNLYANANKVTNGYYFDRCGLLFFASCKGQDSGTNGTQISIYLYGTGTNTGNNVTTLNNARAIYVINAFTIGGANIGCTYINYSDVILVSDLLTQIGNLLSAQGWTLDSLETNVLKMTYSDGFILNSSGVKKTFSEEGAPDNTVLVNSWEAGYQYGVQYFDAQGRTIGTQVSLGSSFTTPQSGDYGNYPYPNTFLQIKNRPPKEAVYYNVVRSNNTTYNKRLFWISESAYASNEADTTTQRFAYIGISNIEDYNIQISSTQGVVSYSFTAGDRIKFLQRYDAANQSAAILNYDYEVLGTVTTITLSDNTTKVGNFIKIAYPANDINSNFQFSGTGDYLHYEIFLYNFSTNAIPTERFFYEFGKCFGIGNVGTDQAYHMGDEQSQSATNPVGVPAIITCTNGDLFYRKRKVPYNDNYAFAAGSQSQDINSLMSITVENSPINATGYIVQTQPFLSDIIVNPPAYSGTNFFFRNMEGVDQTLKLSGDFSVYQAEANDNTTFKFVAIAISPGGSTVYTDLTKSHIAQSQIQSQYTFDSTLAVPAYAKLWIAVYSENTGTTESFTLNPFQLDFKVLKNNTISIIEQSFNDTYNLITNSNGRASAIDVNAGQVYYPTLIRFGREYQQNTNINNINRFYFENNDEYDRSFGDVMRLHVRDRYLKVYQKFKVGNVPILTQIIKDSANNPLSANTDKLINKVQYYAGDYGIGDAITSLAWNNYADYFVDNYRGVVCRLSQDGITPISILYKTNAFFVPKLQEYRQSLNNGVAAPESVYTGNPCIYGTFDAYTNKYIIAMEEINRYAPSCGFNGGSAIVLPCNFNGGTAVKQYSCSFNGGTAVVVTGCTYNGGTAVKASLVQNLGSKNTFGNVRKNGTYVSSFNAPADGSINECFVNGESWGISDLFSVQINNFSTPITITNAAMWPDQGIYALTPTNIINNGTNQVTLEFNGGWGIPITSFLLTYYAD